MIILAILNHIIQPIYHTSHIQYILTRKYEKIFLFLLFLNMDNHRKKILLN